MKQPRMQAPVWSVKSVAVLSLITIGVVTGMVFATKKPILWELTTTLTILAGTLFVFLAAGLYWGARLRHEPLVVREQAVTKPPSEKISTWDKIEGAGNGIEFGLELMEVHVLIGLAVLVGLAMILLLWEPGLLFVIAAGVYWLFSRALRQVFLKSRICRDNVLQTLRYSFMYTTLYTGWMFALLFIGQQLLR